VGDADRVAVGGTSVGRGVELALGLALGTTAAVVHPMIVAPAETRKPRRLSTTGR